MTPFTCLYNNQDYDEPYYWFLVVTIICACNHRDQNHHKYCEHNTYGKEHT